MLSVRATCNRVLGITTITQRPFLARGLSRSLASTSATQRRAHHLRRASARTPVTAMVADNSAPPAGRHALLHDFCMCIPYGVIIAAAGLLAAVLGGGVPALYIAAAGVAEIALSVASLRSWKVGRSSMPFTVLASAVAGWVTWTAWTAFQKGAAKYATGGLLGLSSAATLFFLYNVLAGGNPPKSLSKGSKDDGVVSKDE